MQYYIEMHVYHLYINNWQSAVYAAADSTIIINNTFIYNMGWDSQLLAYLMD